jgi:hypothetical protein
MVLKRTFKRDGLRYDIFFLPMRGEWQAWEYRNDSLLGIANFPHDIAFRSSKTPDYSTLDVTVLKFVRGRDYLTAQSLIRRKHGI